MKKAIKTRKVGRPSVNISRDALRAAVKGCKATERVKACYEIGGKLGCSWLTVLKSAKAKGVRLPLGKRGPKSAAKSTATA